MTRRFWIILLFLTPLPAAIFLFQDGFFSSSDGMIHLYRLFELDRSLHAGILYPRWFPLSGYGYGLPVLNYYPPLAYYLAELFHLLGAGYIASLKLLIASSFLLAAFSMFVLARDVIGDAPAWIAGVAFAYLPYILSDAYVRGNFPEMLAVSLLPVALAAFRRAFETGKTQAAILAACAFAAIILTHHLTAMIFAALLLAYLTWLFVERRAWNRVLTCAGAILLALALAAFYWMPAIGELNLVLVGPGSLARFLVNRLVTPADFFAPLLAYEYVPQTEVLKHSAGFPQTIVALVSVIVILFSRNTQHASRLAFHALFFFLTIIGSIVMMLDISAPLWYAIPTLRFMQFPWRFQIIAGIGIAFLIGVWIKWIIDRFAKSSRFVLPVAAIALIALALTNLPVRVIPLMDAQVDLMKQSDSDYVIAQMGWGWTREFVPATVKESAPVYAPIAKPAMSAPIVVPTVQVTQVGMREHSFRVATSQSFELSLHTFFFPRWQAYIDGAPAESYARGDLGLATVRVPPGDHMVEFRFENTFLRDVASAITLIVLGIGFARLLFNRRRIAFAMIVTAIVLFGLLTWHRRADLANPAFTVGGISPQPTALVANLDNQAMLIGYATERANNALYVTLYWLGLNEMDRDYTSFVHLLDANDAVLAQHDGSPDQGLTPTTRWLAGEIITDRHTLAVQSLAPGEYHLAAGMYLSSDTGFTSLGNRADLGRVQFK